MRIANDIELCWYFIKLLCNTLAFIVENAIVDPIKSSNTIIFTGLTKYLALLFCQGLQSYILLIYHKFHASFKNTSYN